MKVYVLNEKGGPLMPTSPRNAKVLVKNEKAKVIQRNPFTIQLKYKSSNYKQNITLGIDTGFQNIGISAISKKEELLSATVKLDSRVSDRITTRRMYRRNKRNRLRYRKPRFLNRGVSNRKGRLAPSVNHCIESHKNIINKVYKLLPISKLILETGTFNMHLMKNPKIKRTDYQKGEMFSFENTKAYVLSRDQHKCYFNTKSCDKKLEVHHIKYKSLGGTDNPNNLITLCKSCHEKVHSNKLKLGVKKHKSLKPATVMNVIRKRLLDYYIIAEETFGYKTKEKRYQLNLEKSHINDAFVIAGGMDQCRINEFQVIQKRKNNRCLQLNRKGFKPSIRRQRYKIQPKDFIKIDGKWYSTKGVHCCGARVVLENKKSISVKKVENVISTKTLIWRISNSSSS